MQGIRQFDFDTGALQTAPGFTSVRANTPTPDGSAWANPLPAEFDTGSAGQAPSQLFRDFHFGNVLSTFNIAVDPARSYSVRVYGGDSRTVQAYAINLSLAGGPTKQLAPPLGNFASVVLTAPLGHSVLPLVVAAAPGTTGWWVLNGLQIWDDLSTDPGDLLASSPPPAPPAPPPPPPNPFGQLPPMRVDASDMVSCITHWVPRYISGNSAPNGWPLTSPQFLDWTNATGHDLWVRRAAVWTGVDLGGVCDVGAHLVRTADGTILAPNWWDHYANPNSPTAWAVQDFAPGECVLHPNEVLRLYYFSHALVGSCGAAHAALLWIQHKP